MANQSVDISQIDISQEEKDKLVAEMVRYVLFRTHQNSGCPIKREELTHLVTKNYRQRSLPALVINEAISKLSDIFGYEMKEIQRSRSSLKRPKSSQHGTGEGKFYVLLSQIRPDIYAKFVEDKSKSHSNGFTFAVVSILHLAGGKISEENLWHHLKRLGLDQNDENHHVFGNVKNSLEALVQQRYLHKEKASGAEGNSMMYELAERALDASITTSVNEYIAKISKSRVTPQVQPIELG